MKKSFLFSLVLFAFSTPAWADGFSYRVEPSHYETLSIKARTFDEAQQEILKNGYTPFALATCWYNIHFEPPKFSYSVSSGKIQVQLKSLSFLVPSEILLPSLEENGLDSSEERRKWREFSGELRLHEDFHREILAHPRTEAIFREVFEKNRSMTFDMPSCLSLTESTVAGLVEERMMVETEQAAGRMRLFQQKFDGLCQYVRRPWPQRFNKSAFFRMM